MRCAGAARLVEEGRAAKSRGASGHGERELSGDCSQARDRSPRALCRAWLTETGVAGFAAHCRMSEVRVASDMPTAEPTRPGVIAGIVASPLLPVI
jgi:hypothetical protein